MIYQGTLMYSPRRGIMLLKDKDQQTNIEDVFHKLDGKEITICANDDSIVVPKVECEVVEGIAEYKTDKETGFDYVVLDGWSLNEPIESGKKYRIIYQKLSK